MRLRYLDTDYYEQSARKASEKYKSSILHVCALQLPEVEQEIAIADFVISELNIRENLLDGTALDYSTRASIRDKFLENVLPLKQDIAKIEHLEDNASIRFLEVNTGKCRSPTLDVCVLEPSEVDIPEQEVIECLSVSDLLASQNEATLESFTQASIKEHFLQGVLPLKQDVPNQHPADSARVETQTYLWESRNEKYRSPTLQLCALEALEVDFPEQGLQGSTITSLVMLQKEAALDSFPEESIAEQFLQSVLLPKQDIATPHSPGLDELNGELKSGKKICMPVLELPMVSDEDSSLSWRLEPKALAASLAVQPVELDFSETFIGSESYEKLILMPELSLTCPMLKFLPVPALCQDKQVQVEESILRAIVSIAKNSQASATDFLYLDWHLSQGNNCNSQQCFSARSHLDTAPEKVPIADLSGTTCAQQSNGAPEETRLPSLKLPSETVPVTRFCGTTEASGRGPEAHAFFETSMRTSSDFPPEAVPVRRSSGGPEAHPFFETRLPSMRTSSDFPPETGTSLCGKPISGGPEAHPFFETRLPSMRTSSDFPPETVSGTSLRGKPISGGPEAHGSFETRFPSMRTSSDSPSETVPVTSLRGANKPSSGGPVADALLERRLPTLRGSSELPPIKTLSCASAGPIPDLFIATGLPSRHKIPDAISEARLPSLQALGRGAFLPSVQTCDSILVANIRLVDKHGLTSRRSTYQKILNLEKAGVQVVERDLRLPVDLVLSPARCLVLYSLNKLGLHAQACNAGAVSACIENIIDNDMKAISFCFRDCMMVFEGDRRFTSAVLQTVDDVYAAAVGLNIHVQCFISSNAQNTDSIISSCIKEVQKSMASGTFPRMTETQTVAEAFLTEFPAINPLTAHAILSSGISLSRFISMTLSEQLLATKSFNIPKHILMLFRAQCQFGQVDEQHVEAQRPGTYDDEESSYFQRDQVYNLIPVDPCINKEEQVVLSSPPYFPPAAQLNEEWNSQQEHFSSGPYFPSAAQLSEEWDSPLPAVPVPEPQFRTSLDFIDSEEYTIENNNSTSNFGFSTNKQASSSVQDALRSWLCTREQSKRALKRDRCSSQARDPGQAASSEQTQVRGTKKDSKKSKKDIFTLWENYKYRCMPQIQAAPPRNSFKRPSSSINSSGNTELLSSASVQQPKGKVRKRMTI